MWETGIDVSSEPSLEETVNILGGSTPRGDEES